MPTALYRFILATLLLLPLAAHASDAEDFLAANPAQQAKLLQDWAAQPDPARIELVDALQQGQLTLNGETKTVRLNNRLRGLIDNVRASQQLLAADPKVRLAAAQTLQKTAQPAQLKFLDQQVASETNEDVHTALSLALANLQLVDTDPAVRLAAVRLLGKTGDPLARTRLEALLAPGVEADAAVHTAAETSLAQVKRKLMLGEILGQAFSGMSLGSILLLAALGLAITFGLLGVINMAHGEMLMLGAYSTYCVQLLFQRFAPGAIEFYPLLAEGDGQAQGCQQQDRTQGQTTERLPQQIADQQFAFDLRQAGFGGGAHPGIGFDPRLQQVFEAGTGQRLASFTQQAHGCQTHGRIGVDQLQIGQRQAQGAVYIAVGFVDQLPIEEVELRRFGGFLQLLRGA